MSDDTFELLTRIYADFTSQFKAINGRISTIEGKISSIEDTISSMQGKISSLENDVLSLKGLYGKMQLKIENDIERKIDLLLETRTEVNNRLDVIENKIDALTTKVDRHDIEIKVIKAAY